MSNELPSLEISKGRVLEIHPKASCFETNLYWPGKGARKKWIVLKSPIMSTSFAQGDTEELAWERAAVRVGFERLQNELTAALAENAELTQKLADNDLAFEHAQEVILAHEQENAELKIGRSQNEP